MVMGALNGVLRGIALAGSVAVIAVLSGCGGDDAPDSAATGAEAEQARTEQTEAGGGGIENFGEPAGPGDRADATRTVQEFLRAWADGNWAEACSLMAASTEKDLEAFASKFVKSQDCTEQAEALRSRVPKMLAPAESQVTGVRIEGDRGFVLYRDARGNESAFPIVREGSAWKVAALAGLSLP